MIKLSALQTSTGPAMPMVRARRMDRRTVLLSGGVLLLLLLPTYASYRILDLAVITLLFAMMALGLQMIVGFCQLLDLGFAGFVCIGAYSTGILMLRLGWSYWLAAACAIVLAMASGVVLGLPTLRLRGDYFAIVTFGFSEVVVLTMRNWKNVTGGPFGLGGIPDPGLLGAHLRRYPPSGYYFLALGCCALVFLGVSLLRRTMLGGQMIAIGDDERLCSLAGIDEVSIKVAAFALSAGVGGLAGSFWAVYFKFLSHLDFTLNLSVQVLSIVILAAGRSVGAVLVVAAVVAPMSELLRTWLRSAGLPEAARVIFYGILLIAVTTWRAKSLSELKHVARHD